MIQELVEEKERRSKAELAAGRLVEHVRSLQTGLEKAHRDRELAVAQAASIGQELRAETEMVEQLRKESAEQQVLVLSITFHHSSL